MIAKIDSARAAGFDVQANMYPYTAGGTGLAACLPPFASADGKLFANLADEAARAKIRAEVAHPTSFWESLCEQAFINIVQNAHEAMEECGGILRVEVATAMQNGRLWSAASRPEGAYLAGSAVRSIVRREARTSTWSRRRPTSGSAACAATAVAISGCKAYCAG